jgi:transcriptional regulator
MTQTEIAHQLNTTPANISITLKKIQNRYYADDLKQLLKGMVTK